MSITVIVDAAASQSGVAAMRPIASSASGGFGVGGGNARVEVQVRDPLRGAHKLLAPLPPRLEAQAGTEHGDLRHELEADAPSVDAPRSGGRMVVHGARIEAPSRMALGVDESVNL